VCNDKEITVSKDIMEYEMNNADVYAKEEKLSLSAVAEQLVNAQTRTFTATFRTKVDEKEIKELLNKATAADIKDSKTFAK